MKRLVSLLAVVVITVPFWPSQAHALFGFLDAVPKAWPAQIFSLFRPNEEPPPQETSVSGVLQDWPAKVFYPTGFLFEGDVIGALPSGDIDVYIINQHGFKRLFLNPAIYGFYGHLFGFEAVKDVSVDIRNSYTTSGLFRNCEINDSRVYGLTVLGEDTGVLHLVDTSGEQAVLDDPDFFKKVFCINQKEFDWYPIGQTLSSVNEIPDYARGELTLG